MFGDLPACEAGVVLYDPQSTGIWVTQVALNRKRFDSLDFRFILRFLNRHVGEAISPACLFLLSFFYLP